MRPISADPRPFFDDVKPLRGNVVPVLCAAPGDDVISHPGHACTSDKLVASGKDSLMHL